MFDTIDASVTLRASFSILQQKAPDLQAKFNALMIELEQKNLNLKQATELLEALNKLQLNINVSNLITETIAVQLSENALVELNLLEQLGIANYEKVKILHSSGLEIPFLQKHTDDSAVSDKERNEINSFVKAVKSDLHELDLDELKKHQTALPRIIRNEIIPYNIVSRKVNALVQKVKKLFKVKQSSRTIMTADVKKIIRRAERYKKSEKSEPQIESLDKINTFLSKQSICCSLIGYGR